MEVIPMGKNKKKPIYIILICLLVIFLITGTTYALVKWSSRNTTITGTTMCFDILYEKGQDIDFGTTNTSGIVENGMTASLSFDESSAASTSVGFARQNGCLLYGQGTITVNINSGADLTKGGLKYKVVNNTSSAEVSSGSITKTGETIIYDGFTIINSTTYTIYFWLDANYIDNSYLETTFSGTISATAISLPEYGEISE